jgi:hypothetical protein
VAPCGSSETLSPRLLAADTNQHPVASAFGYSEEWGFDIDVSAPKGVDHLQHDRTDDVTGAKEDHGEKRHAESYGKRTDIGIMGEDDAFLCCILASTACGTAGLRSIRAL